MSSTGAREREVEEDQVQFLLLADPPDGNVVRLDVAVRDAVALERADGREQVLAESREQLQAKARCRPSLSSRWANVSSPVLFETSTAQPFIATTSTRLTMNSLRSFRRTSASS
jgi:hypothetical protein